MTDEIRRNAVDLFVVPCPVCQAGAREPCRGSGFSGRRVHRLRRQAAEHAAWENHRLDYEDFRRSVESHGGAPEPRVKKVRAWLKAEGGGTWHRTEGGWRRAKHENPDLTLEQARLLLSGWGGYSELLHKAALAMPPHLRDPEIIAACELLAKAVEPRRAR